MQGKKIALWIFIAAILAIGVATYRSFVQRDFATGEKIASALRQPVPKDQTLQKLNHVVVQGFDEGESGKVILEQRAFDPFYPFRREMKPVVIAAPFIKQQNQVAPTIPKEVILENSVLPAFAYKLFGRLKNPAGITFVYLEIDDQLIAVESGSLLKDGYSVANLTASEIIIKHAQSGGEIRMRFPTQINNSNASK